ncbi:hypothetical protein S83_012884 [Arachis hypogaea]
MEELLIDKDVENRWSSHDPPTSSLSSSKVDDDLDGISLEKYFVWTPNLVQALPNRCKKSNSTGSNVIAIAGKEVKNSRFASAEQK